MRKSHSDAKNRRDLMKEIPSKSLRENLFSWFEDIILELFLSKKYRSGERDLEVLSYRYGLFDHEELILEDLGILLDNISKQRVKQLEKRAFENLYTLLNEGYNRPKQVILKQEDYEILREFKKSLKDIEITDEIEISNHVKEFFSLINLDLKLFRLLLRILDLQPIILLENHNKQYYVWANEKIDVKRIRNCIDDITEFLHQSIIPKTLHEIILNVNKKHKKNLRYSKDDIESAIKISRNIETLSENQFQLKYCCLRKYEDKAYRILYNNAEPMNIRQLSRELNVHGTKCGENARINTHHIGNRLSADSRFEPIGRSGDWILAEWGHITTDYILDLMKDALHTSGKPLPLDEIFSFVKSRRPVKRNAIAAYLEQDNGFSRVGTNLYALTDWGMSSVSTTFNDRAESMSKAKICELIEEVFQKEQKDILFLADLSKILADKINRSKMSIYNSIANSPSIEVSNNYVGSRKRKIAKFIPNYRSKLSKLEKLTKDISVNELIQNTILEILISTDSTSLELRKIRDEMVQNLGCSKTSVYHAIDSMEDVEKINNKDHQIVIKLKSTGIELNDEYKQIANNNLIKEIERALSLINLDTVDLGLFQLGKIFEATLKNYLSTEMSYGNYVIASNELGKLYSMITCVKKNGIITDESVLQVLRVERNGRAHGASPNKDERKALLANSKFLVNLYLDYIFLFEMRREKLIEDS